MIQQQAHSAIAAPSRGAANDRFKGPPCFGGVASLCASDRHRLLAGLRHLSELGLRPIAEFVLATAHQRWNVADMLDHLGDFANLSSSAVRLAGADRLPTPAPMLMAVPR